MLTNLYNVLDLPQLKLSVLMIIIRAAADAKQLDLLGPFLAGAGSWQAQWGLTDLDARKLYLLISQVLDGIGETCVMRREGSHACYGILSVMSVMMCPFSSKLHASSFALQGSVPVVPSALSDDLRTGPDH